MLTTVAAFREPWEAHMFCSRLKTEGIPAFVAHEYHVGNAWHYSVLLDGVKVQVPDDRKDEAKAIEKLCRDGEFKSLLESKFGAMDDVRCPNCGSDAYWKRRPLLRAVIAITVSLLSGTLFPPLGWVYFCNRCGTKFMQPMCPKSFGKWAKILMAIAFAFVVLLSMALCLWALGTRYWFVVAVAAILAAGRLTIGRLARPSNIEG